MIEDKIECRTEASCQYVADLEAIVIELGGVGALPIEGEKSAAVRLARKLEAERELPDEPNPLISAFVQGAKWWEWTKEGATMWQSDQSKAMDEAEKRLENGTLGLSDAEAIAQWQRGQNP